LVSRENAVEAYKAVRENLPDSALSQCIRVGGKGNVWPRKYVILIDGSIADATRENKNDPGTYTVIEGTRRNPSTGGDGSMDEESPTFLGQPAQQPPPAQPLQQQRGRKRQATTTLSPVFGQLDIVDKACDDVINELAACRTERDKLKGNVESAGQNFVKLQTENVTLQSQVAQLQQQLVEKNELESKATEINEKNVMLESEATLLRQQLELDTEAINKALIEIEEKLRSVLTTGGQ